MPKEPRDRGVLGENLLRARKRAGLTQAALAEKTHGVAKQTDVTRIESGATRKPGYEKVAALAQALGVDVGTLTGSISLSDDAEATLQQFLAIERVTPREEALLRDSVARFGGKPTIRTWGYTLDAIRSMQDQET